MGFRDFRLNEAQWETAYQRILQPFAEGLGVSQDEPIPETKRSEGSALMVLDCGAQLYLNASDSERFPAANKRAARIGARGIAEALGSVQAHRATEFLAIAFSRYLIWIEGLDPDETLERIEGLGEHPFLAGLKAMDEHFPADDEFSEILEECERGFRALEQQDGSGDDRWTHLLWAEAVGRGEVPADAIEEKQRVKAGDWYVAVATRAGVELGLPRPVLQRVQKDLMLDLFISFLGDSAARNIRARQSWNVSYPKYLERMMNGGIGFPELEV